jgi:hypothetical protein
MSFNEITLSNGDCEVMIHVDANNKKNILSAYCYTRDTKFDSQNDPNFPKNWKFKESINPLFSYIIWPDPKKVKNILHRRGFVTCGED